MANISQTPILINLEGQKFATYGQPEGIPEIQLLAIPVFPITLLSGVTTIPTALTNILTISINSDMFLSSIQILPSANCITNGVAVFILVNAGSQIYYFPTNASNGVPVALQSVIKYELPPPYYMFIPNGSTVQIWTTATNVGSALQILLLGFNASGVQ